MALYPSAAPAALVQEILQSRPEAADTSGARAEDRGPGIPRSWNAVSLPPPGFPSPLSVPETLDRRHAVRDFRDAPVPAASLAYLLTAAHAGHRRTWTSPPHPNLGLLVLIAALHVDQIPAGLYLAGPDDSVRLARFPAQSWLPELRTRYAVAPVLLLICGDIQQAALLGGGSGYGAALVQAGALGHAAWLAAISVGLAGCPYGRTCHQATLAARLLGPGYRHLFTVAVGHPRQSEPNRLAAAPGAS